MCTTQGRNAGGLVSCYIFHTSLYLFMPIMFLFSRTPKEASIALRCTPCLFMVYLQNWNFRVLSGHVHEGSMTRSWAFMCFHRTACAFRGLPGYFHGSYTKSTSSWFRERWRNRWLMDDSFTEAFTKTSMRVRDCRGTAMG